MPELSGPTGTGMPVIHILKYISIFISATDCDERPLNCEILCSSAISYVYHELYIYMHTVFGLCRHIFPFVDQRYICQYGIYVTNWKLDYFLMSTNQNIRIYKI